MEQHFALSCYLSLRHYTCHTSRGLDDAGGARKRTKRGGQMTPMFGDLQSDQCSVEMTQEASQHQTGRNSASYFAQNLAAAMAPGGSRSSSQASAGSTVVAEVAELQTAGSDVYLDANGLEEAVEELTLNGSNEFIHKPLGNQNMKQWGSAAGYLQQVQHHLLFGDMNEAKMGSGTLLTKDMRNRRLCERPAQAQQPGGCSKGCT
ncbi:TPA: hypothetical protein ACH3X1_013637 [Trebouxia sp. C0004]